MIKLDDKYHLRNNSIHGVELVFEEERQSKKGELKTFTDIWYYPNPVMALKKWIELTDNSTDLSELIEITNQINQKLEIIKNEFINNKRKL